MLRDGFPEGHTLLRVLDGIIEGSLGNAHGTRRHIDTPNLQAAHRVFEALALFTTQQGSSRYMYLLKQQFRRVHALIAKLIKGTPNAQSRRSLLDEKDAHATIGWMRLRVRAGQHRENAGIDPICHP